jgi:hypothetical protein
MTKLDTLHEALKRRKNGLTWNQAYSISLIRNIPDAILKLRRKYGSNYIITKMVKPKKGSPYGVWKINPEYKEQSNAKNQT